MSLNVTTEISNLTPGEIARVVKNARLKKALTQKELSELAGISLRSLQRIENAAVSPRLYTLSRLAEHINLEMDSAPQFSMVSESSGSLPVKQNLARKWILSISSFVVIVLSFSAFVVQSPTFPENLFETLNMFLFGCVMYAIIIYRIWK